MIRLTFFSVSLARCRRCISGALMLTPLLLLTSVALAEKTDFVELLNGDRITGEVSEVQRGKLKFKTDDAGTINIEWTKVAFLSSKLHFEFQTISGQRYFGKIARSNEKGMLVVVDVTLGTRTELAIKDTVSVGSLDEKGRPKDRFDGSFDFGYSRTKSTDSTQLSFDFDLSHRDRKRMWSLDGSTLQSEASDSTSDSASLLGEYRRFLRKDWFWSGNLKLEKNDELGLDLRKLAGGGVGRYLIRNDTQELAALAGLAWADEKFDDGQTLQSTELMLGLSYDLFRFDSPKIDLSTKLMAFPSITISGRVRAHAEASLRYEIVKDLFAELNLSDTYDNKPPSVGAEKNDYSITTSLGYTF